jgi:hypothetical protein
VLEPVLDDRFVLANKPLRNLIGASTTELVGAEANQSFHVPHVAAVITGVETLLRGHTRFAVATEQCNFDNKVLILRP